jgi:predicted oxidoreductase
VCLENNSTFDHADIYGDYTTETDFEKHFLPAKSHEKNYNLYPNVGSKWLPRTETIKHYEYSKEYIIWSVENS